MTNTLADYNMTLVFASYGVSVLGAFTGLLLGRKIDSRFPGGGISFSWLALASIAFGGCAIWAMHFIGMLAYEPGGAVSYDIPLTLASLALPILFTMAGLYVVHRWPDNSLAWLAAGLVMGLGVSTMHYTGMAAMRMQAVISYDPVLVALSVVIAVIASTVALRIAAQWRGALRLASSLLMGVAVCGMHYTGMAAMSVRKSSVEIDYFTNAFTRPLMEVAVSVAVTVVAITAGILAIERSLGPARGKADA